MKDVAVNTELYNVNNLIQTTTSSYSTSAVLRTFARSSFGVYQDDGRKYSVQLSHLQFQGPGDGGEFYLRPKRKVRVNLLPDEIRQLIIDWIR